MKNVIYYLLINSILITNLELGAQNTKLAEQAQKYLLQSAEAWGLKSSDLSGLIVTDQYISEHNGLSHFYFQQTYRGIPIYNAVTSVHVDKEGRVYDSPSRFVSDLSTKVNALQPRLQAIQAMEKMILHYKVVNALLPKEVYRTEGNKKIYSKTNFTHSDIPAQLMYVLDQKGKLILCWDISMDLTDRPDYWSTRINAITGEVMDQFNYTISCQFDHPHKESCRAPVVEHVREFKAEKQHESHENKLAKPAASSYNVLPVPVESPIHGSRRMVTDPEYPNASPFGWHDTNGQAGPEFTITRGNNVNAYLDRNADNAVDAERADGGPALNFDFPFDQTKEPANYTKAAMVNLFYMNNMMHDVLYQFGFNEAAGNFQQNNYNKGGTAGDQVLAEAQDGSGVNNANFSTPADGGSGRMQMFLWSGAAGDVAVVEPTGIAGPIAMRPGSGWGGAATETPLVGEAVWSDDGVPGKEKLGCRNTQNAAKLNGKIAVINRGECEFSDKALFAQNAGAIAVIICGFNEENVSMGAGVRAAQVRIPCYFGRKSVCDKIIAYIENGLIIKIQKPTGANSGPDSLDGDFDNGIIAHEYGHGISTRLTGGPAQANCLANAEQMGEGWSDFMSLIMTAKAGDNAAMIKGIGNYATNAPADGIGIRRRPYTTNKAVNEFTYRNINSSVHDLGEVWNAMLWDLYWALSDKYGYDPNFANKNSGNNIAIQLVMDAMKIQPCRPGIVDGRNAILKADSVNNKAANACLIWEVFAGRGVGFNSKQGDSNFVGDETEDFESYPVCVNKTVVSKSAPYVIKAGQEFTVNILVRNLRPGAVNDVRLEEAIPDGCTFVNGSSSLAPTSVDGSKIIWNIATMNSLESRTITYRLKSATDRFSLTLFFDDFESPLSEDRYEWVGTDGTLGSGSYLWSGGLGVDGSTAWWWETSAAEERRNFLFNLEPIQLPDVESALYFYHKMNTQQGIDGGYLELSTDRTIWERIDGSDFLLNGYPGDLSYSTFVIPFLKGFSGYIKDFTPVVVDISKYKGKPVYVRFVSGNDDETESNQPGEKGWIIDNLEMIKPYFYNSDLCLTTGLGDQSCVNLGKKGVLVDSKKVVSGTNQNAPVTAFRMYPNPTRTKVLLQIPESVEEIQINLRNMQGQLLQHTKIGSNSSGIHEIDLNDIPKGVVLVECIESGKITTHKLIIK